MKPSSFSGFGVISNFILVVDGGSYSAILVERVDVLLRFSLRDNESTVEIERSRHRMQTATRFSGFRVRRAVLTAGRSVYRSLLDLPLEKEVRAWFRSWY